LDEAVNRTAVTLVSLSYATGQVLANNFGKRLVLVDACRAVPKNPSKGAKSMQSWQITRWKTPGVFQLPGKKLQFPTVSL